MALAIGYVKEVAAIGIPDPIKGSAIVRARVLREDGVPVDEVREGLIEAIVAGLGTPFRPEEFVFCPDLSKTRDMKIIRRVVRSVYLDQDPGDLNSLVNPESIAGLCQKA